MIPVASFNSVNDNGTITFTDTSTNDPDYFLWIFGDGTTSTLQNPVHTYLASGTYAITFSAANNDGTSVTTSVIAINLGVSISSLKIDDYIGYKLPKDLYESFINNPIKLNDFKTKWFYYVGPLIDLKDNELEDESKYGPLGRSLVAELIIYDIFDSFVSSLITTIAGGYGAGKAGSGAIKKITTGPSEAEWYDSADFWASASKPGGMIDQHRSLVCALAFRLGVYLPFCPAIAPPVLGPELFTKSNPIMPFMNYMARNFS